MFVKKPDLRPEDMGHKNPPLHDLNMESRRIDAAIRDSEEHCREAAITAFTRVRARRQQKNLRAVTPPQDADSPLARSSPMMIKD